MADLEPIVHRTKTLQKNRFMEITAGETAY